MTFNVINNFTISYTTIGNISKTLKFNLCSVKKKKVVDKNEENQKKNQQ
jgi:hypothetical protein